MLNKCANNYTDNPLIIKKYGLGSHSYIQTSARILNVNYLRIRWAHSKLRLAI